MVQTDGTQQAVNFVGLISGSNNDISSDSFIANYSSLSEVYTLIYLNLNSIDLAKEEIDFHAESYRTESSTPFFGEDSTIIDGKMLTAFLSVCMNEEQLMSSALWKETYNLDSIKYEYSGYQLVQVFKTRTITFSKKNMDDDFLPYQEEAAERIYCKARHNKVEAIPNLSYETVMSQRYGDNFKMEGRFLNGVPQKDYFKSGQLITPMNYQYLYGISTAKCEIATYNEIDYVLILLNRLSAEEEYALCGKYADFVEEHEEFRIEKTLQSKYAGEYINKYAAVQLSAIEDLIILERV